MIVAIMTTKCRHLVTWETSGAPVLRIHGSPHLHLEARSAWRLHWFAGHLKVELGAKEQRSAGTERKKAQGRWRWICVWICIYIYINAYIYILMHIYITIIDNDDAHDESKNQDNRNVCIYIDTNCPDRIVRHVCCLRWSDAPFLRRSLRMFRSPKS